MAKARRATVIAHGAQQAEDAHHDMPDATGPQDPLRLDRHRHSAAGDAICLRSAAKVPNGECVGHRRLLHHASEGGGAVEAYGKEIPTVRDYRSLLDSQRRRRGVTRRHWPTFSYIRRVVLDRITEAGKNVYCEKPMSHQRGQDGFAMVRLLAVQKNKRIFQAGSQRVLSPVVKGRGVRRRPERLGETHLVLIEGHTDRNSDSGAWVYPHLHRSRRQPLGDHRLEVPGCATPPTRPFDAAARSSAGAAGPTTPAKALPATSSSIHPQRACRPSAASTPRPIGLYSAVEASCTHFKDGRDFPDLLTTLYDYNGVAVNLRVATRTTEPRPRHHSLSLRPRAARSPSARGNLTFAPQDTRPQPEVTH